jgi:hypothetical protein
MKDDEPMSIMNLNAFRMSLMIILRMLLFYKKAMTIDKIAHPHDHLDKATSYNNIGSMFHSIEQVLQGIVILGACSESIVDTSR